MGFALQVGAQTDHQGRALAAAEIGGLLSSVRRAVHKSSFPGADPLAIAFEDLCSRFDMYLQQIRMEQQTRQCGLIILDESAHEAMLRSLARQFRLLGTRWGIVRHLADTPMFMNSSASRIVQLADHVAYAVFRRYEAGDTSYFDVFASRFFASHGVVHGLAHKQAPERTASCMCPACLSRRRVSVSDLLSLRLLESIRPEVWN